MRNLCLISGVFASVCGSAIAADLSARAVPVMPSALAAAPRWAGPYLGINAGAMRALARSEFSLNQGSVFGIAPTRPHGAFGGVLAGYGWQSGAFVFGAEMDVQLAAAKAAKAATCAPATCGVALAARYQQEMPWFGTIRARAGYASGDWLFYATGGYAFAKLGTTASASAPFAAAHARWSDVRHGWALGGGVEVALTQAWSVKAEFLHLGFGHRDRSWAVAANTAIRDKTGLSANLVRAGLNYGF